MSTFISAVKAFGADENGVTAIEYGLIAALIGVAIVASAKSVGSNVSAAFDFVSKSLSDALK